MADATNLPAVQPLKLSQPLAEAIVPFHTPHPEAPPEAPPTWMLAEIRAAHAKLGRALGPTEASTIARWIIPLASMVSRAPEGDNLRIRVQAMAQALTDLPICCWTAETQRQAARTFKWWPSVAEISDLVSPAAQPLRMQRAALQRMMFVKPTRGSPEARQEAPEERAAHAERNRLAVQALADELADKEAKARSRRITPSHLSAAQRVAHFRAMGQHATADAIARAHGIEERAEHAA